MPLQIQNWQGREGAIQLCSFEAVANQAFICDECGIHEDGSVPTIWCEFPQGHKDNLAYHKECFITILRKATKDKNVARCVDDEVLATMSRNIKARYKEEDIKVTTVKVSIPMIEQLSEAEPVIQQLSDTKAENQSLKQLGFGLEDLGASDESAMKEMLRKATKKKKNHYTKQKQEEEPEDEPSINPEEDAPSSRSEMKPQEKKRLTCFLYCGGERRVLPNGTFDYVGGISEAMLIEDNASNKVLISKISSCLNVSLHNKSIFYNTKRDKTKYIRVKDNNGVKMMFYLNEDEVDVFVDEDPFDTSTRESNIVESNNTPREKKRLTCFCNWNNARKVLSDGTFDSRGGVSYVVLIDDDVSYQELRSKICSCLRLSTSFHHIVIFYNLKRDKTKYLCVNDDNGVEMLFHLNEEEVDVFVVEDPSYMYG